MIFQFLTNKILHKYYYFVNYEFFFMYVLSSMCFITPFYRYCLVNKRQESHILTLYLFVQHFRFSPLFQLLKLVYLLHYNIARTVYRTNEDILLRKSRNILSSLL